MTSLRLPGRRGTGVPRLASDTLRGYVVMVVAILASLALPLLLPTEDMDELVRASVVFFIGWIAIAVAAAILQLVVFWRASPAELVRWLRATEPDGRVRRFLWALQGGGAISWAVTGSAVAMIAVVALRLDDRLRHDAFAAMTGIAVVAASLLMIVTSFAVRYARQHAIDRGLGFPGDAEPRFGEFLYLALQIAVTFGGSDVEVRTSRMRGLVSVQAVIAFLFNTVVVALLVSLFVG